MEINEEDLKLSKKYIKAIQDANNIINDNLKSYKEKHSDYIEAKLFLDNKELIKKLLFNEKNKGPYLYEFMKSRFDIQGPILKLLLCYKGYLVNSIKKSIIFIFLFFISLFFNFYLNLGLLHAFSLILSTVFVLISLLYVFYFIYND